MLNQRCAWPCLLAAVAGGWISAAVGADSGSPDVKRVNFHIAQQPIGDALTELGEQSGLTIGIPAALGRNIISPSVQGTLTPAEALQRILEPTGLVAEYLDLKTVAIHTANIDPVGTNSNRDSAGTAREKAGNNTASNAPLVEANPRGPASSGVASASRGDELEEVVVTGTHISGIENKTTPVMTISREMIDRSGYTSTQELIGSLPQNFSGGQNGATETSLLGNGSSKSLNISNATGINLRGLGTTSTLVLIDGHRVASAIQGTAVDVSLIPISAIERIEILPDGASALYGSDAVAGVVNFVLRKDYDGSDTRLSYGAVTTGSTHETAASETAGTNWNSGSALLSGQFRDRSNLPTTDRSFTSTAPTPTDILPESRDLSLLVRLNQKMGASVDSFAEATVARKTSDRFETTAGLANLSANDGDETTQYNLIAGAGYHPSQKWNLDTSASFSREGDHVTAWYAFGKPAAYVNGTPFVSNRFDTWSIDAKGDGDLWDFQQGQLRTAIGTSYREEYALTDTEFTKTRKTFNRNVKSAFFELYAPLFPYGPEAAAASHLDVSSAIRYDRYSDFGATTNWKAGVAWTPVPGLTLRGSFDTSFRAPSASEEFYSVVGASVVNFPFAKPGGGITPVFLLSGTGEVLRPETARNFSFGVDYKPFQDTRVSLSFYNIDFRNRIIVPPLDASALLHPDVYGSLLTSFANAGEAQAFLQDQLAQGATFQDPLKLGAAAVRNAYNIREQNAAEQWQSGLDALVTQSIAFGTSRMLVAVNATVINHIDTTFAANSAVTETVNTYANPLKFRARGTLGWQTTTGWQITSNINYSGSYNDTTVVPVGHISSWTTVDAELRYSPSSLNGFSVGLSALNLFDKDPPRTGAVFPGVFFDVSNADPLGRFVSVELRERW